MGDLTDLFRFQQLVIAAISVFADWWRLGWKAGLATKGWFRVLLSILPLLFYARNDVKRTNDRVFIRELGWCRKTWKQKDFSSEVFCQSWLPRLIFFFFSVLHGSDRSFSFLFFLSDEGAMEQCQKCYRTIPLLYMNPHVECVDVYPR